MKTLLKIIGGILTLIGGIAVAIFAVDAIALKENFIPMVKEAARYGYSEEIFERMNREEP